MKTILDTIIEHKRMEILKRKERKPLRLLEEKPFYKRTPIDPVKRFVRGEPGIIAEFKRKSPSKGMISDAISPGPIVQAYKEGGAVVSSVLTDRDFFGGSFKDLENVREGLIDFPLLRKDFIIDSYQVHEAKAYGADIILLISAILDARKIHELSSLANSLGLAVLLEIHDEEEIDKWSPMIKMVGVNNRDLRNFTVDIRKSAILLEKLPVETIKISESGLHDAKDVKYLFEQGYDGFLMGEYFMKSASPGLALKEFIDELNAL